MVNYKNHTLVSSICWAVILIAQIENLQAATFPAKSNEPSRVATPQLPLLFEQNQGQFNEGTDYVARGDGYSIALGPQPVIELYRYKTGLNHTIGNIDEIQHNNRIIEDVAKIKLNIQGARNEVSVIPLDKQLALTHYLVGTASDWRTDIPNFKRVRYSELLPGIDVEYYGRDGRLEYDFVVHPGADPAAISFEFEGVEGVAVNADGDLVIDLGRDKIIQYAPVTYQSGPDGQRFDITSEYTVSNGSVGFRVAAWDRNKPLVIDPVLEYSNYYGGAGLDYSFAVDLDTADNIYVIGTTDSTGLATTGAYVEEQPQGRRETLSYPTCDDCTDGPGQVERAHFGRKNSILVTKLSPDGKTVIWSTYFSGTPFQNLSIGINSAAVSGTGQVAFGITNAPAGLPLFAQTQTHEETQDNAYVAKLNATGSALVLGTYLNLGDGFGLLRGLDVSPGGEVAVTGMLGDNNTFPVVTGIPGQSCTMNATESELKDGYVALFGNTGVLTFSSCLGGDIRDGSSTESLRAVKVGINGDLYVAGYSSMTDFPVVNPIQATKIVPGAREVTISQINPGTGALVFSTWFGRTAPGGPPPGFDFDSPYVGWIFWPWDIETDSGGNIIVIGSVGSLSYQTINALQTNLAVPRDSREFLGPPLFGQQVQPPNDFFIVKLHPVNGIVFSTYLGGSSDEGSIPSMALDSDGNSYLVGVTKSDDYPMLNAIQSSIPSDYSRVLSKITPSGALAFSTYIGGSRNYPTNAAGGIAVNSADKIIVSAVSLSDDFPIVGTGTGTSLFGPGDITLSIINQSGDTDTDGDGVPDSVDAFPADDSEWKDTDNNLTGDNADTDDDGDGEPDVSDRFPQDASETTDADNDGAGDNRDEFDADLANYFDLDNDGLADFDAAEVNLDGDGADNSVDAFDFDDSETVDSDRDGVGDNTDEDDDGDLTPDIIDPDQLDFDVPTYTFERYLALDTNLFKSPWPDGFLDVVGADASWTSAGDHSYSGDTSFSSRVIDHGQVAAIQYTDTYAGGFVQFWYKVDSQESMDLFTFKIDSTTLLTNSGDTNWQLFSASIPTGIHTLEWRYTKDGSVSAGDDAAWIDDVVIIDPAINCNAKVVSGVVETSNASYEACEQLTVGSFTAEVGASVSLSSGQNITMGSNFQIDLGATLDVKVCGQSLCEVSESPMPDGCHSCVSAICDVDPSCCSESFDSACLSQVGAVCGLVCE